MTLQARLDAAQARSVKLYLHRQALEAQAQRLHVDRMQCDQELVRLDGEIDSLIAQMADEKVEAV